MSSSSKAVDNSEFIYLDNYSGEGQEDTKTKTSTIKTKGQAKALVQPNYWVNYNVGFTRSDKTNFIVIGSFSNYSDFYSTALAIFGPTLVRSTFGSTEVFESTLINFCVLDTEDNFTSLFSSFKSALGL